MILFDDRIADSLYRGVLAKPDNDLQRLVLADRLEEIGQAERAEFIRVQVSIEGGTATEFEKDREGVLFRHGGPTWFGNDYAASTVNPEWFADLDRRPGEHVYLVYKGFISAVRAPLDWLRGGECECGGTEPCELCNGTNQVDDGERGGVMNCPNGYDDHGDRPFYVGNCRAPCPACHGTGRAPGHLRELVRKWPLTKVVVTDREPQPNQYGGPRHSWTFGDLPRQPSDLPYTLIHRMTVALGEDMDGRSWVGFPTREAAVTALSDALLQEARSVE